MHLIGWLSFHLLLVFFLELLCSFIWAILFVHQCLIHCKWQSVKYLPRGVAQVFSAWWCCMWGRGLRWNNAAFLAFGWHLVISPATHKQIVPFWCWFVGGRFCVHSRILWVSATNTLVRLGVSLASATPTDFYRQRFWGFISSCWNPGLHGLSLSSVVPPGLSIQKCRTSGSASQSLACPGPSAATLPHVLSTVAAHLCPSYHSEWMFLL